MSSKSNISRRSFLQHASALPLVGYLPLAVTSSAFANTCPTADARSLVCVFLAGGADSFNFAVPGGNAYDSYASIRGSMAVQESDLLGASDSAQGEFGFNSLLPETHRLYQEGQLAVVSNVGNLIRPTTPADFKALRSLPQSLFAHDAQAKLWQTAGGNLAQNLGWGGSIAEQVSGCNAESNVATSISIAGSNVWLNNLQESPISLSPSIAIRRLLGFDGGNSIGVEQLLNNLLTNAQADATDVYRQEVAFALSRSINTADALVDAMNGHPVAEMTYSGGNGLARQLHMVARLISAREQLNMGRQVFFVALGGWDTHTNQNERFVPLLNDLDEALSSFQAAITSMGKAGSVTTYTASDFGRTLTTNGDGTDHGWGGHSLVMGGSVLGGQIYGSFPSFVSNDNPDDAGTDSGSFAGRIIPGISVAQYGAALATWMGVSATELNSMFPALVNFGSNWNSNLQILNS